MNLISIIIAMDKHDLWRIGANCTDVDCKKAIQNSDCFAGLCKCTAGYGPSNDQRKCKKSKRFGSSCHPLSDTCYQEKLLCDPNTMICQCAPGYRYDSGKNDCIWYYYCDDNLIWDNIRRSCIKPSDYWFPTTNHNPKLSFITFLLLVFCFIKVMRSNAPYSERRRRISGNINRNSFDLLSTIMNYENKQRYAVRGSDGRTVRSNHASRRTDDDSQEVFHPSYDENQPPPPYEEIVSDLKTVTVISNDPPNTRYLSNNQEDIELKEMNQVSKIGLQANSQTNLNNNQYPSSNHIESQSTSSESSSGSSGLESNQETENNNRNSLMNVVDNLQPDRSSSNNRRSIGQLNGQCDIESNSNAQSILQSNNDVRQSYLTNGQSINQPHNPLSEDQLPTYQQAISKMPPV